MAVDRVGTAQTAARQRPPAKLTPMLAQYLRAKEQAGDAVLFFRLGDFYEMFFEDAELVAPLLDLTLTSRNKDDPNPIPMCGVPHHAAQSYVSRLLAHGLKVAICEQTSDAQSSPGLIERGLTRIITPGTVLDEDEGLATSEPGYLVALGRGEGGAIALATLEASTGELRCCEVQRAALAREELVRIGPREVLVPKGDEELLAIASAAQVAVTQRVPPSGEASSEVAAALDRLLTPACGAGGAAALRLGLEYLCETVRGSLAQLSPVEVYSLGEHLMLEERTRRNLAVLEGTGRTRHGSLWWAIDRTTTPMGARRLRDWLLYPLLDLRAIGERLDAVEALAEAPGLRADLAEALRPIGDAERLVGRICLGRAGPREVARLGLAPHRTVTVQLGDHRLLQRELAMVDVEVEGERGTIPVTLGEEDGPALLGYTALEILGFKVNPVTQRLEKTVAIEL